MFGEIAGGVFGVILGAFDGIASGRGAAGDDADDEAGGAKSVADGALSTPAPAAAPDVIQAARSWVGR